MPFYLVGHLPPPSWSCDSVCQVGAVAAESEATADRMAEERYPMRPGFELELLVPKPYQIEDAKRLVFEFHERNRFWQEFCRRLESSHDDRLRVLSTAKQ